MFLSIQHNSMYTYTISKYKV